MMIGQRLNGVSVLLPAGYDNRGVSLWGEAAVVSKEMAWGMAVTVDGVTVYPDEPNYEWTVKRVGVLRPVACCDRCGHDNPVAVETGDLRVCIYCVRGDA